VKTRTVLAIGFFGGDVIGGGATFLSVAPAVTAVLMKPLEWLASNFSSPYPSESPANLLIAIPLMFIYWGCLGAFVGLLLRAVVRLFVQPRERDEGKPQ
jgi:hypothetical protein